jgi:sulfonate transport system permease protein
MNETAPVLPRRARNPQGGKRRTSFAQRHSVLLSRVLAILVGLALWEFLGRRQPLFVAEPWEVAKELWLWVTDGTLAKNSVATVEAVLLGFGLGVVVGVVAGWLLASIRLLDVATRPFVDVINAIPRVGLAPLFVLWFGLGLESKVMLVFSVIVFVVLINAYSAIKSVNPDHVLLVRSLGATKSDIFRKVVWPSSMPWIIASLRLGGAYAVSAAVVGEFVAASRGLGFLLAYRSATFDTSGTYAALVALSILAALITLGVMVIEKRALKWRVAGSEEGGADRGAVGGLF